jgi:hypothetical protein
LKQYNSYHTSIKQLAIRNRLPAKYSNHIDRSTLWKEKNEAGDKYPGVKFFNIDLTEKLQERKDPVNNIRSYFRLGSSISSNPNTSDITQKIIRTFSHPMVL